MVEIYNIALDKFNFDFRNARNARRKPITAIVSSYAKPKTNTLAGKREQFMEEFARQEFQLAAPSTRRSTEMANEMKFQIHRQSQ